MFRNRFVFISTLSPRERYKDGFYLKSNPAKKVKLNIDIGKMLIVIITITGYHKYVSMEDPENTNTNQ